MTDKNDNPLNKIFIKDSKGQITNEIDSIKQIPSFFNYLENEEINEIDKITVIEDFIKIIKINRYVCAFFSLYNNKSIYLFLFELYMNSKTSPKYKEAIINLLDELRINIQIDKEIFEYLFQKLSILYRGEISMSSKTLYEYLKLLYVILGDTVGCQKPKNYYACNGNCKFFADLNKKAVEIGNGITIILNFKISSYVEENNSKKNRVSTLIKLYFSNLKTISVDLEYPFLLIVKEIRKEFIKTLPLDEWVNLIISITNTDNKLQFSSSVNGENHPISFKFSNLTLKSDDTIKYAEFFNNFYGEVSTITLLSQKEIGIPAVTSSSFLSEFKNYKEGLWKKKKLDTFFTFLSNMNSTVSPQEKNSDKNTNKIDENKKTLFDNIAFIFTPLNYISSRLNFIDDVFCKYQLQFNGNVICNQYTCYQKKLNLVCGFNNFFPIAEMFLLYPESLNEENFELFLKIIANVFNYRKQNLKSIKPYKFFKVLSLFFEKYPNQLFTEKILDAFDSLGKILFMNNIETICSSYFKHILLNEKILTKYKEDLQIKFWNKIFLFCQSDISQIEIFMNINRLCLILRYYDRNKYVEFCCEEHMNMFKKDFIGSDKIMNPTMITQLANLKNVMDLIIDSQEPSNAFSLFKLLSLDLSPCLTKFILHIFIDAFEKPGDDEWKNKFVDYLTSTNSKYEVIITNTFIHALPDVKIDTLKLMYVIHVRLVANKKTSNFRKFEKMIKTCLLPQKMFYEKILDIPELPPPLLKSISNVEKQLETKKPIPELKKTFTKEKEDNIKENKPAENKRNIPRKSKDFLALLAKFDKTVANPYEKEKKDEKQELPKRGSKILINAIEENINLQKQRNNPLAKSLMTPGFSSFKKHENNNNNKNTTQNNNNNNVTQNNNNNNDNKNITQNNNNIIENNNNINQNDNNKNINEKNDKNNDPDELIADIITDKKTNEVIVLKDEVVKNYLEKLFSVFFLWSLSINVEYPLEALNVNKSTIKNSETLEIVFVLMEQLKNKKFLLKFLKYMEPIVNNIENAYILFYDKKILSSFVNIAFLFYKKKDKDSQKCYDVTKNILTSLFINSLVYMEKNQTMNSSSELETIFIWGNKIREESKEKEKENLLFDFIFELFMEYLTMFKIKFETKMKFDIKNTNFDLKTNYPFKNYLIFISKIYYFLFYYKLDPKIHDNSFSFDSYTNFKKITQPILFRDSMRIDKTLGGKITQCWIDFPLIHEIITRIKFIWGKANIFKKFNIDKYKNNKPGKYDAIMEEIILDKDKKNIFQNELEFICFEETKDKIEIAAPLIKIIPQTFMSILSLLKTSKDENEFKYWLKEFKCFLRFIIIASSNLTKVNQLDLYNLIQDKCLDTILIGLCFFNDLLNTSTICINKIEKSLTNIFMLCIKLLKFQYNYNKKHKIKFLGAQSKNDLTDCAVVTLFNNYIKDKDDDPLLTIEQLESILDKNDPRIILNSVSELHQKKELNDALFANAKIKSKLINNFYSMTPYIDLVKLRYTLMPFLDDDFDYSYKKQILEILPQYENELVKYSNNSLEKNIKIKNAYKTFKKNAFSWSGYWSNRQNFYENISLFKEKLINHYTKNFMKPIIVPILDINYYLPEFSGFNIKTLFKEKNAFQNNYLIKMDIDDILKKYDQDTINEKLNKNEGFSSQTINYLRNIYSKSNKNLDITLTRIADNLEFGTEEEFNLIERESNNSKQNINKNKEKKYFLSCLVKTSHHIKGVCFIDDKNLNFKVFLNQKTGNAMSDVEIGFTTDDDDYDKERHTCFGSYFVCHPKDKDLYKISIFYSDIKFIFKRRYYYTNSALEIYTKTNKTFYFNFKYEKDREIVLDKILQKLISPAQIIDDLKEVKDPNLQIVGYQNEAFNKYGKNKKQIKLSKKIRQWKEWKISNFELLMWMNIFGNRSYNDISQYPIFPWTLSKYEDPLQIEQEIKNQRNQTFVFSTIEQISSRFGTLSMPSLNDMIDVNLEGSTIIDYLYRDMNLPMGMLELNDEGIKRKESFIETYETLKEEPDENMKPYVFGSNYSNPVYVCNYLMRIFPFTNISIELQGQRFDAADRLFLSVKNSFYNSTSQKTDVRELIPEFFYLPEMFLNINNLNMGKLQTGEEVNDVETPCNNNPYDFIMTMKTVLENEKISENIQNWIDLIFGYKVKGKEAENAHNIFTEASYQENIDITKIENKESYLRMVEFGLIPNQIMNKEFTKKDKKEDVIKGKEITDPSSDLILYKCKLHNENDNNNISEHLSVLKFASFNNDKVTILFNNSVILEKKISYSKLDRVYYDEQSNLYILCYYANHMYDFYNPKECNNKTIQFCNQGKTTLMGGFYDGKVLILSNEDKNDVVHVIPFIDNSPIVSVEIDKDEHFAFLGSTNGNIRVLKVGEDSSKWKLLNIINAHKNCIANINCSSELNLWASASVDGYINLYTLPLSKLIRSIKVPIKKCDYVFLSDSPLPSIIVLSSENDISEIFVYSINGKLLLNQKEEAIINCPIMIKDLNSNNYLAYIRNESVVIRSCPKMFIQTTVDNITDVYAICTSEDRKILYATNKSGTQIYVIKDL